MVGPSRISQVVMAFVTMFSLGAVAFVGSLPFWYEPARDFWKQVAATDDYAFDDHEGHDHGSEDDHDHGHDHGDSNSATSIEISDNGLKNIRFRSMTISESSYTRYLDVPGLVVERPGHSQLQITAPLTGIVTEIRCVVGEAVQPGETLFTVRLTHEELVESQRNLVRIAENLDVVKRELSRLGSIPDGVISGRAKLDQEYEKQKLEASLLAEYQGLLLHGLNEDQIDEILESRQLLRTLHVTAPTHEETSESCDADHSYHVQSLPISRGQQVESGEQLCVIADHCELFIEGQAFEEDALVLRRAVKEGWLLSAAHRVGDQTTDTVDGLQLEFVADRIDVETRAFRFYVRLPNEIVSDQVAGEGQHYIEWRYKPGQRMDLKVPVERWEDQIVIPQEAAVEEGPEVYVYVQNGNFFEQVPVHIAHRDRSNVVIESDGSLFPGDRIATRGAYQIHLALKNSQGGGIDPHAGHNH